MSKINVYTNMYMNRKNVDCLELHIKVASNDKIIILPCFSIPEVNEFDHDKVMYKFFHSNQKLHCLMNNSMYNDKYEISAYMSTNNNIRAGKDLSECIINIYTCNLTSVLSDNYDNCDCGIYISSDKYIPLYLIQVDIDYKRINENE